MKLEDFYVEQNDVFGMPQHYKGIPIYPIKLLDFETANLMEFFLVHDKLEFVDKRTMPFDGIKQIYKNPYMKAMLYGLSYNNVSRYYEALTAFKGLLLTLFHIGQDADDDNDIIIICNTNLQNPLDIFNSVLCIIVKINGNLIKLEEEDLELLRQCILKQNGISLKSIEGYNADMEAIKRSKYASEKTMSFSERTITPISVRDAAVWHVSTMKSVFSGTSIPLKTLRSVPNLKTISQKCRDVPASAVSATPIPSRF